MEETMLDRLIRQCGYMQGDVVRYWAHDENGEESLSIGTIASFWDDDGRLIAVLRPDLGPDYVETHKTMAEIEGRVEVPDLSTPEKVVEFLSA